MDPNTHPSDLPQLLFNGNSSISDGFCYRIMCPIGTFSGGRHTVYKAAVISQSRSDYQRLDVEDIFVAVKCVNAVKDDKGCEELRKVAESHTLIPAHENIIQIRDPFSNPNGHYCVVFPYMSMGSMRYILRTKFPDGMPEECIVVVLREALKGLSALHKDNRTHGELNSGNILLNRKPEIKLSLAASLFVPTEEQYMYSSSSPSSSLPIVSICEWATAPEAYNQQLPESDMRASVDVWMIGITALELACGGLQVPDREALEYTVGKINRMRKLPTSMKNDMMQKLFKCLGRESDSGTGRQSCVTTKRVFSKKFGKMVAQCLEWDYQKRPSTDEILNMDIFTSKDSTMMPVSEFYNLIRDLPVS